MILNKHSINKILIIKPRGIGDVILSTIVLKNLKETFSKSEIHYLTENFCAPVLNHNPFISKIYVLEKSLMKNLSLIYTLNKENYDIIFDFYSNPRTAQFTFLTKAKIKLGYYKRGRNYAYDIKIKIQDPDFHSALCHLEFLKEIGIKITSTELLYYLTDSERIFAKKFFTSHSIDQNCIALIPGGGWSSKRCEPEKFAEIAVEVNKIYGSKFLILYGDEDYDDAIKIFNQTKKISFLAPPTTIREMVALISNCRATIANDSGPMHLSAAIGIPTIGIFGPTNPSAHGPFGNNCFWVRMDELHCIQCNLRECPYNHECMKELNPVKVVEKLNLIFNANE